MSEAKKCGYQPPNLAFKHPRRKVVRWYDLYLIGPVVESTHHLP